MGNCEKVLLLFTKLPGELYFMFDWKSTFFMVGALEEELNSRLKLRGDVTESQEGTGREESGEKARQGVNHTNKHAGN